MHQGLSQQPEPTHNGRQAAPRAKRVLTVLGATGSVGKSTLDLISRHADAFAIDTLTAQNNVNGLAEAALRHRAKLAVIGDARHYQELKVLLAGSGIEAAAGEAALIEAAERPVDCVMAAIVGAAALKPILAAARRGGRLALANKECLVSAGDIFMRTVAEAGTELIPVDSEHSAAFQALAGADPTSIERIVITASGGPFRTWPREALARATPEQASKHPNWSMGPKITIDSATLMNKGLELIEAYHLFPVEAHQLGVVVHPQSIVHCLVEFTDGSVLAPMANPDMRTPIALSLAWPARMHAPTPRLDLVKLGSLSFEAPDEARFPALRIARAALALGGTAGAILNAANEVAVEGFVARQIGFLEIATLVEDVLTEAERTGLIREAADLADVLQADAAARDMARGLLSRYG
ncbi:MAG: 1-deoxy-D-xylulose-5-phosphate reductoisomerase [Bacteroidota bacterium]